MAADARRGRAVTGRQRLSRAASRDVSRTRNTIRRAIAFRNLEPRGFRVEARTADQAGRPRTGAGAFLHESAHAFAPAPCTCSARRRLNARACARGCLREPRRVCEMAGTSLPCAPRPLRGCGVRCPAAPRARLGIALAAATQPAGAGLSSASSAPSRSSGGGEDAFRVPDGSDTGFLPLELSVDARGIGRCGSRSSRPAGRVPRRWSGSSRTGEEPVEDVLAVLAQRLERVAVA